MPVLTELEKELLRQLLRCIWLDPNENFRNSSRGVDLAIQRGCSHETVKKEVER